MADEGTEQLPGAVEYDISQAAVQRFFLELGERTENLRLFLSPRKGRGILIYNLQVRWPRAEADDYLIVVKGVRENEPVIAFHSHGAPVGGLLALVDRHRSGKLKFKEDEYPPQDWEELVKQLEHQPGFIWTP